MNLKENRKLWIKRVKEYRKSGMKAKEWCAKEGVNKSALSYWVTKLNKENNTQSKKTKEASTQWLSINVVEEEKTIKKPSIDIKIGLASIEVENGFDKNLLLDVLGVLKSL